MIEGVLDYISNIQIEIFVKINCNKSGINFLKGECKMASNLDLMLKCDQIWIPWEG